MSLSKEDKDVINQKIFSEEYQKYIEEQKKKYEEEARRRAKKKVRSQGIFKDVLNLAVREGKKLMKK